ncbi:hypothetical protein IFT82_14940 [Sphingomonas sp. CFBP 8760]|nr:hypothetical protein [Sphingomonas sp. CFBP 8760]
MTPEIAYDRKLYCSFCGKAAGEVCKLIAGPTVFICDECVTLCQAIVAEEATPIAADQLSPGQDAAVRSIVTEMLDTMFDGADGRIRKAIADTHNYVVGAAGPELIACEPLPNGDAQCASETDPTVENERYVRMARAYAEAAIRVWQERLASLQSQSAILNRLTDSEGSLAQTPLPGSRPHKGDLPPLPAEGRPA